ncbi:UNKNOWN [Stylonychia lemnae]|uniref:Uncharacterized protein n=1 Tax=Stylonychia lemnae TaxID=5949 RepID=A0A078A1I1_STYLE|nr:UNKNOWN [Stylonychia lemnae]|eukprot:CDW75702.1 UNKNOWN [Stylonychia lemnae]
MSEILQQSTEIQTFQPNQIHRKIQPKQTKNFSPMKAALILDHYQGQASDSRPDKKQTQNSQERKINVQLMNSQSNQKPYNDNIIMVNQMNPVADIKELYHLYKSQNQPVPLAKQKVQFKKENFSIFSDQILQHFFIFIVNFRSQEYNHVMQGTKTIEQQRVPRMQQQPLKDNLVQKSSEKIYFSQPRPQKENTNNIRYQPTAIQQQQKEKDNNQRNQNPINSKQQLRTFHQSNQKLIKHLSNTYTDNQGNQQRYLSQDTRQVHNKTINNTKKQEFIIESTAEDLELLSFQKEIERRYRSAQTKFYVFPRVEPLVTHTENQILESYIEEQNNKQLHYDIIIEEDYQLELESSSLQKSMVNKYQGLQSQKNKEKFCEKLKKTKTQNASQQQLIQPSGLGQLQIKSIEVINYDAQHNLNLQTNSGSNNIDIQKQLNQTSKQQFFQNTHKRVQNPNQKNLEIKTQHSNQNSQLFQQSGIYPLSTKYNSNQELIISNNQAQYFASGNQKYVEPQFTRNIVKPTVAKSEMQNIEKQKMMQLTQLIQKISGSQNQQQQPKVQTERQRDFSGKRNQNSENNRQPQQVQMYFNGGYEVNHKNQNPPQPQSPTNELRKTVLQESNFHIFKSPMKYQLQNQNQQNNQTKLKMNQINTPSKQKSLHKVFSQQALLQNSGNKVLKQSMISTSYKKFKEMDESQSKTSRNNSQQSSSHAGTQQSRSRQQSSSQSKRDYSDNKSKPQYQAYVGQSAIQNISKINNRSNSRRKLKNIASTLQITGSQAISKNYDIYSSIIQVKSPQNINSQTPSAAMLTNSIMSPNQAIKYSSNTIPLNSTGQNFNKKINTLTKTQKIKSPHTGGSDDHHLVHEFQ